MKIAYRVAIGVITLAAAAAAISLHDRFDRPAPETDPPRGVLVDIAGRTLTGNLEAWQAALNVTTLRKLGPAGSRNFLEALFQQLGLPRDRIPRIDDRTWAQELHVPARLLAARRDEVQRWLAASEWGNHRPALLRFIAVSQRVYPQHDATAALVGLVDSTGYGIEGLERALDRKLSAGESQRLTVDLDIQAPVSTLLEEVRARRGMTVASAVVIDLRTGEVRAILSVPGFDPANLAERTGKKLQLAAVTRAFQAGPLLEPFLLHGIFSRRPARDAALAALLEKNSPAIGGDLVAQFSGPADVWSHFTRVGLLDRPDADFPGVISTLVRRTGTEEDLLRDLGNGAGIAPNLLHYSATLAGLIAGLPARPVRLVAGSDRPMASADPGAVSSEASRLLREVLVERARRRCGDNSANFGGVWAAYRDRVDSGVGMGRAGLALFTPAVSPAFLVTVALEGEPLLTDAEVLELGRRMLAVIGSAAPRQIQAGRGTSFASRS